MIEKALEKTISTKDLYLAEIIEVDDKYGFCLKGYMLVRKELVNEKKCWVNVLDERTYPVISPSNKDTNRGLGLFFKVDAVEDFISYYDALKIIRKKTEEEFGVKAKKVKVKKISKTKRD